MSIFLLRLFTPDKEKMNLGIDTYIIVHVCVLQHEPTLRSD